MILELCHSKLLKEINEQLYASDWLFKPYHQIANSPFLFPYISYRSSEENLFKYQQNLT